MRLHISWLIGWWCLGLIGGTALCSVVINPSKAWLYLAVALVVITIVLPYKPLIILVIISGCLFGLWRGSSLKVDLQSYQEFYETSVTVEGMVSQDASYGERGDQRLNLRNVKINGRTMAGEVWISTAKKDIKRGDIITVQGKLKPGFGNLSATMYKTQIVSIKRPNPGDIARRVRDWFAVGVKKSIPDPEASLGLGYLLGQKTALPPDLEADIKAVGLTHAVVASGYNLTILVVFCRNVFMRVSKYFATLTSILMVLSFMLITGLSPSMTRAGLVACLGLLVWYYGRKMHPFVLLSFAAGFTVLIQPSYIWGDLGWYLSFLSFVGVIVLAPLIHNYFWGLKRTPSTMRGLIIETMSAQIITTPIILMYFGIFSTYALLANLLVLPLVPMAMLLTFIAGAISTILPGLSEFVGVPATIVLKYSTYVIQKVANIPNSQIEIVFNPQLMIASYIFLGILIAFLIRRTKHDFRGKNNHTNII